MSDRDLVEGINIIFKNTPEKDKGSCNFNPMHDQIYYGEYEWVTGKDAERLLELGWFEDEDAWSYYT